MLTFIFFFFFSFFNFLFDSYDDGGGGFEPGSILWKAPRGTNVSSNLYYIKWALYKFMEILAFLDIYIYIYFFSCNQIATLFFQLRIFDPFLPVISFIFKWFLIMHLNPFNFVLLNFYHVCHSHISILAQSLYSYFLKCNVYFSKKGEKSIKLF